MSFHTKLSIIDRLKLESAFSEWNITTIYNNTSTPKIVVDAQFLSYETEEFGGENAAYFSAQIDMIDESIATLEIVALSMREFINQNSAIMKNRYDENGNITAANTAKIIFSETPETVYTDFSDKETKKISLRYTLKIEGV